MEYFFFQFIKQKIVTLLDDMIVVMRNTIRIITHQSLEQYVKQMNSLEFICDIQKIITSSVEFTFIKGEIVTKVQVDFKQAEVYVKDKYERCRPIAEFLNNWNQSEFEKEEQSIDTIKQHILDLKKWRSNIIDYIKDVARGILHVNGSNIKKKLQPAVQQKLESFQTFLYNLMRSKVKQTISALNQYTNNLSKNPNTLKEYADFIEAHIEAEKNQKCKGNNIIYLISPTEIELAKIDIEAMHSLLRKFENSQLDHSDTVQLEDIQQEYVRLLQKLKDAADLKKDKKNEMIQKLEGEVSSLTKNITNSVQQVNYGRLVLEDTVPTEALQTMTEMKTRYIDKYKERDRNYTHYGKLMGLNQQTNNELLDLESKFNDRTMLWTHVERFNRLSDEWFKNNFTTLNVEDIEKEMKNFENGIIKLKQNMQNLSKDGKDKVLETHAAKVQNISLMMPVIQALGNKDLRSRHWKRIFEILGQSWQPGKVFTLSELIQDGVLSKKDQMEEISGRASGEAGIEMELENIKKKWQELTFMVNPYRDMKDKFIIGGIDDIIAALDEHQLKVQTMLGMRFVAEIRPQVEEWERKLVLISDFIDEWLYCQRQWMYLENIFNAEDIQKQLMQETTKFFQVDKFWKEQMMKTHKRPLVQDCCSSEDILKKFQLYNKVLEEIQKSLENYLETKRAAFPRFYFLSNDELLEILSQTRNPHAVQNHLRKCFDNVNRINFTDVEDSIDIIAMQSAEPETQPEVIPFSSVVVAEGAVEHWLMKIQNMMVKTLYEITKAGYFNYPQNPLERDSWLFEYFAQPVLTVDQIKWTEGCTQAIEGMAGDPQSINRYYDFIKELISREVIVVRGQLDTLQRTLMGALIVLDVHNRDVVQRMAEIGVSNINDFEWAKQLRYYWDTEEDDCVVRQTNTRFVYGYEYLGNGPRLVITSLTDKCYMTLTGALHLHFGGAPEGPAGTGKTETTKDMAKALAVQCVVFNCSEGLDFKTMGRFFSGLAQCGAWACFDEFNRIDIEVLSVIAQQILTIQQAIRAKLDQFDFEGRVIPLNIRFGVFITMNPGYAGRTELPDNLKALFRPVAMMIPNYQLIAEIILFSEGFETAKTLAKKMFNLYKLSSEQLSKQDHYDFGMRAVKSVLVMAGSLRRRNPDLEENVVLIRAMRDSNVPKFLEHDLPLFRGIIQDLFPGVLIKDIDYGNLQKSIEDQLENQNYQKTPKLITKIIQLMETIMVRHGVMVVGQTGTGKSTVIYTLSKAMEQLHRDGSQDYYHKPVKRQILNPKAVTMNELFGYTNVLTNEWTDGIVANIVRTAKGDSSDNKKWVIFDGPVDALWIENMNTVLDDNKMLCLNSGERIKLPHTFTMMFEVQDLAVASPATVSRCGMVYMEFQHLGWEPLLETWGINMRNTYRDKDDKVPPFVVSLIDRVRVFFKENLNYLREEFKEIVPSTDNNLLKSCMNLCQIMLNVCREQVNLEKMSSFEMENYVSMVLIFCFIWSAGANLHDSSRPKFSQYIKGKILKYFSGFPFEGDVYDYYCDYSKKEFRPWNELVTEFRYSRMVPYFNILVPTADTVKFKYLLEKLIAGGYNVLISGETGTGKSVIINEFITSLNKEEYVNSTLNFSAQTSSKNLQDLFLDKDKFMRKKKDLLGPPAGRKMCLFIDDVNMPALEQYGAQPPNELFRQIIDQGGFFDLKKLFFVHVKDVQFITACAPPGGGRNPVTPRLFRHFNMLWCPDLSARSMETIFTAILKGFLLEQNKGFDKFAPYIVKSSVDIYFKITKELLPTPTKSHYTFNLRDLSKVFQGIVQIRYENLSSKDLLIQLWAHEAQRVFYDRLVDEKDKNWFLNILLDHITHVFEFEWEQELVSNLLFGDYANANKDYVKIENPQDLPKKFNDYLVMYNINHSKQMNLVFFTDAIMHLSRLCRVLKQMRGNALLIGVGGSGRQSLTKLSSYTRGYNVFQIEIAKNYKEPAWKDDLRKLLKTAGAKNTEVVFLFSDSQIVKESFLEDINNILNTGEVPNLWGPEDIEEIISDIRPLAKEAGLYDSREVLLKYFVSLVRENLHIVLAFSPVGEKLRNRCLQFPSIINCCTIDWFDKWPVEALSSVAHKEYNAQEHLGIGEYVEKLSQASVTVHTDVQMFSTKYFNELRRYNYVTPTSYLELLKLYIEMMKVQQNILPMKIRKYTVGLKTLKETNEEVEKLKKKIIEFQPILEQSAKDNETMMIELEGKTKVANETEAICSGEAAEAQKTRDEVNEMRDSCQKELDEALPILEAANQAVKKIDKGMINEMKSFKQPPTLVGIVMNSVCVLFGEKEDWDSAKKILGRISFLNELLEFNVDTLPEKRLQKLRATYLSDPNFNKEKVQNVSLAATTLLVWVTATEKFANVKKVVGPKEKKLKEAEAKLREVEQQLAIKQASLKEVQDMVSDLKRNLDNSIRKSEMLKQQQETAKVQLVRAEKLVYGLASEAKRWEVNAAKLEEDLRNLTGNIILAAASIAYLGPFTYEYRSAMLEKWIKMCKDLEIPVSDDFKLQRILTEEVQIREWQEAGLPADSLSIENGIFIFNCGRWPLIIDPQGQANKWIKNLGRENNLQVTKLSENNFLKTLENCIRFGQPVLLENVEEELDPALEPILLKQKVKKGAMYILRLGDQDIPYNQDFKLYFTTKLPNPHYVPEISIKTTIINFTVTPSGLEDQLLVEVVRYERIDLEEKRVQLILQISQDKRQLQDLEDKILKLISDAQGRILEEEDLITTLDASKITSDTVNQRMAQSKITAEEIDVARESFRPVAKRGSVIYFVIADLALIDPMYQYSLEFFVKLFKRRLEAAPNPPAFEDRLIALIDDITKSFYINICRGLFEKHKQLFSFMIAAKIQLASQMIRAKEWTTFMRGLTVEKPIEDEIPEYIPEKNFRNLQLLSKSSPVYSTLEASLRDEEDRKIWEELLNSTDPWNVQLPESLKNLECFQKLLLLKFTKEEKLVSYVKNYVLSTLQNPLFTESPLFDLKGSFQDSSCTTPIIFVLSPGADPINKLLNLAKEYEMETKLKIISLGQGQGDIAKDLIKSGRRTGDWVCLQNCHLAIKWMPELERIQELQVEADTDPNYRLWLTSAPTKSFPVPVLQQAIKLTNEPPKGLKANLMRTFAEVEEKDYESCQKQDEYKRLLFSLGFFHAVILERKKFGAIGWNIPYEWMNSDFEMSQMQLKMYLDEQPDVPYQTLNYIISQINYGGRVQEDQDVRLISALLGQYFCPSVIEDSTYTFSSSGVYHPPSNLNLADVRKYIQSLPMEDDPEVFGLHINSNITCEQKNVNEFMDTLISMQPKVTSSDSKDSEKTPDQIVYKIAKDIEQRLPKLLPIKREENMLSLQIFRAQEADRFNILLRRMKTTLVQLQKAIQGIVVMSMDLEKMFNSFLLQKVPLNWEKFAYPSLKPLASWVNDFIERIAFFREWIDKGTMISYWISSLFFPQGFITASLQNYARATQLPIDTLMFKTEVRTQFKDDLTEEPEFGVNVNGLFIQGCRWDSENETLEESHPKVLFVEMPVIWLNPVQQQDYQFDPKHIYECPLYKTSTRRGVLQTTGHSSNFVMYMKLQSKEISEKWIRRGVALLCLLDD